MKQGQKVSYKNKIYTILGFNFDGTITIHRDKEIVRALRKDINENIISQLKEKE